SVGLPFVQWLPPRLAYGYARTFRPALYGAMSYEDFTAEGSGWQNATLGDCLPSAGIRGLEVLTETAGYGWRFFRDTARSRARRTTRPRCWQRFAIRGCGSSGGRARDSHGHSSGRSSSRGHRSWPGSTPMI